MHILKPLATLTAAVALFTLAAPLAPALAASSSTMPTCAAGDPVVWINTKSHAYHYKGDPYFGTTKSGKYACESNAVAAGAHKSGSTSGKTPSTSSATMAPMSGMSGDAMASPAPAHKKKHHHTSMATPAPSAT